MGDGPWDHWGKLGYAAAVALFIDGDPHDAYSRAPLPVALWADRVFDWLEETPVNVRARAHQFTTGERAVVAHVAGDDWLIIWEYDGSDVVVRYLGQNTLGT